MMISPESFAQQYEGASLEELIEVRNELIGDILYFEKHCIDFEKHEMVLEEGGQVIEPGPDVIYQVNLEYLAEISKMVSKAFNEEYEQM